VLEVTGQVHQRHASGTDRTLYGVAIDEGGLEALECIRHSSLLPPTKGSSKKIHEQ
jgi:hypothetical protein